MEFVKKCEFCGRQYSKNQNVCAKQWAKSKFCSRKCDGNRRIGKRFSIKSEFKYGFKHTEKSKIKLSQRKGPLSGNWKGGSTPKNTLIRQSSQYKEWREKVFKRDNYTCQLCGKRGCKIQADHIAPFSLYPELRFSLDNGRTLCVDCHKKTPSYLKNTKKIIK